MKKLLALSAALLMQLPVIGGALAQPINDSPLSDPRVRQAIAYAVDMDTIAETLFEGGAIPAVGLQPNGPNKPDDLNPYTYDPDKARELLAAAGWDSSKELEIVYYYGDQLTADFMAAIQAYLADVGISVNYRLLEGDVGAQLTVMPDDPEVGPSGLSWDIAYGARAALAPHEYFNRFAYGQMPMIPNVPEMNDLVADANGTADVDAQREAFFAMERIVNENAYIIPLYYQQLFVFRSDRIDTHGSEIGNEQYNYDWGIENWTVEPNEDGEMVVYTNSGPEQFFELPWRNLGIYITSKAVFDTVLQADGSLTPIGGEMAESYEVSEDGLTLTLNIREDAYWHDGEPITGEDVAWSIATATLSPTTQPTVSTSFRAIKGAEAFVAGDADSIEGISVDGQTVTLTFETVAPNILLSLTQFHPLPMKYFEGVDPLQLQQAEFWQKPVGSGPYMIEEVQMNDFMTLVPFEQYHGGVAKIDQIIVTPSGDGDGNLIRNAAAGRADFGYTKNTADVPALEELGYITVTPVDIPYTRMFWINQFPRK